MPDVSREAWLQELAEQVRPRFADLGAPVGPVRIGVGFTSKGMRSKRIGECWTPLASADGVPEVFVHPMLGSARDVAPVVVHELVHAGLGVEAKHGPRFKRVATRLGLGGKMTATTATDDLWAWLAPILDDIGPYPHAPFLGSGGLTSTGPKQTTRMLKAECPECGYLVRTTQKWLDVATPVCPVHPETEMMVA